MQLILCLTTTLLDNILCFPKIKPLASLNHLRPLNKTPTKTATSTSAIKTSETTIVAKVENNIQEKGLLLTENDGNQLETKAELNEALTT